MDRRTCIAAALVLACACCALAGCFGMPQARGVAATVNGENIYEDEITDYIEGFRSKNDEYGTDAGWAEYLARYGSAEGLRAEVLDTVFVPVVLVGQECAKRNIAVTDSDLDSVIAEEKSYYEGRYGADSWDSVLASFGYDEESWRDNEENRLLEDELANTVVADAQPDRSEVQAQANAHASDYNGKHSYYISFPTLQQAAEVYATIAARADGRVSLKRFKRLGKVVDAGWSSLSADRDNMSSEYLNALNDIEARSVSEPVEDAGRYVLVYCDEVFAVAKDSAFVKLSALPDEIHDQIVADARKQLVDTRFEAWLAEVKERSDIVVEPMPAGLPYDVDAPLKGRKAG